MADSYPPVQIAFDLFAEVGRLAVMQELKVRLLANKTREIQDSAYAFKVSDTEDAILKYFSDKKMLTEDESKTIVATRKIRNKVLHCEFDAAVKLIEAASGKPLPGPGVKVIKIAENATGEDILKSIFGDAIERKDVKDTTLKEGGLFGWLLDLAQRGGFSAAIEQFKKSLEVIDRLTSETAKMAAGQKG